MKIRTKVLLVLITVPIIILLQLGISWSRLSTLDNLSASLQANYEITALANHIRLAAEEEAIILRNLVILEDENSIQQELIHLQSESESIKKDIALIESSINSTEQTNMVENLIKTNQEYNELKENVKELMLGGNKQEAINLINRTGFSIQDEFIENTSDITTSFASNMKSSFSNMSKDFQKEIVIGSLIFLIVVMIVIGVMSRIVWSATIRLNNATKVMTSITDGSGGLNTKIEVKSNDEVDSVGITFNRMVESLQEQMEKEKSQNWIKSNIAEITTSLSGIHEQEPLAKTFLSKIVPLMESCHAVFYVKSLDEKQPEPIFQLIASYAFKERKHLSNTFRSGEGLIGQAILEKSPIILTDVPSDYIRVKSGLGEAAPLTIYVLPVTFEGDVKAVIELASFKPFTMTQQTFLEEIINGLGIVIENVMGRNQLAKLLEESQLLVEEVQAQSEELQSQQDELRATNEELEEQTQALRQSEGKLQLQQEELEETNAELNEKANRLEEQNKRVEQINREVGRARAELEEKAKQLTLSAKYKSEFLANMSHELRTPLNSLLILSKLLSDNVDGNLSEKQVEYSKTIYSSGSDLLTLINDILDLSKIESGKMEVNPSKVLIKDLAKFVETNFRPIADEKNLRFNVVLKEGLPLFIYSDEQRMQQVLKNLLSNAFKFTEKGEVSLVIDLYSKTNNQSIFSFSVIDTGIGIPKAKQELIFRAFQQADGTTSRKYGGTGLGLSICREISNLLGGNVVVESEEGKGSSFTFYVGDYQEKVIDTNNAVKLNEVAVTLDHKPEEAEDSIAAELNKPFETKSNIKRLLIVDDDMRQRNSLMELIGDKDVIIKAVSTGNEAIEELKVHQFDCLILDLGLTDTTGFELLGKIKSNVENQNLKVFIYTGRDLSSKEELYLNKYAHAIIIKDEYSPQRLLDELELYLNSSADKMEVFDQTKVDKIESFPCLEGKKILLVDDDVRNVYALSSLLEQHGMKITFAENGREGLELLEKDSDFDLVLMDIMMPEMDGYEAIQRLRAIPKFKNLPVIALTAKAMKEDREKCMDVGASDYIVKPVDSDQLISLMRVWLYQEAEK